MFCHKQLGEVEDDIFYAEQVLRSDLIYAQAMLNQPISDYEKERWQADISQSSNLLTNIGTPDMGPSQMLDDELGILKAGFDLSSVPWPVLAILGVGVLVASRKGAKKTQHKKRRRK